MELYVPSADSLRANDQGSFIDKWATAAAGAALPQPQGPGHALAAPRRLSVVTLCAAPPGAASNPCPAVHPSRPQRCEGRSTRTGCRRSRPPRRSARAAPRSRTSPPGTSATRSGCGTAPGGCRRRARTRAPGSLSSRASALHAPPGHPLCDPRGSLWRGLPRLPPPPRAAHVSSDGHLPPPPRA